MISLNWFPLPQPGPAAMNVFLGLNASNEDLGLKKAATWSYPDNDTVFRFDEYAKLEVEEALEREEEGDSVMLFWSNFFLGYLLLIFDPPSQYSCSHLLLFCA